MQTENVEDLSKKIDKFRNYSKENGNLSRNLNDKRFTLRRKDTIYCQNCKNKNDLSSIYCKSCGASLERVVENKREFDFDKLKSNIDFRYGFKVAFISSAILMFISFLLGFLASSILGESLAHYLNTSKIFLMLNGAKLSGSILFGNRYSGFFIQLNSILSILVPIFINMLVYRFLSKDRENVLNDALGVGIAYSVILTTLSLLSRNSFAIGSSYISSYTVSFGISFLSIILRAFLIGFLAVLILNLKKLEGDLIIFKFALKSIAMGYLVILVMICLGSLININYTAEFGLSSVASKINIVVVFVQLAAYLWSFANFIPLSIAGKNILAVNLFSSSLSIELKLFLIVFIAISALILIICGNKLKTKFKNKDKSIVLRFSILYAVIMGILAMFTAIDINMSVLSGINIYVGNNVLLSLIISFLYSYIFTYIGYKLNSIEE